jgi:hypothetical protein
MNMDESCCKDCGAKLDDKADKGRLFCAQCGPLRVVKEQWKPFSSGSSIQGVYHVPDYGDTPRPEPRKWPN